MEEAKFLIITGMSGAGKTQTVRTLEDLNYFCVDNMPPALIPKFAELSRQTPAQRNIALVVDVRGGRFFDKLIEVLDELRLGGYLYELLFLDASDPVLIRRYKETRRRHPLGSGKTLSEDIAIERSRVEKLRDKATYIIDTTDMTAAMLKTKIKKLFSSKSATQLLSVSVQSFGFKYGLPLDSDMVLDVRFLPNPFYEAELKTMTGKDEPVAEFLERYPQTGQFLRKEEEMLEMLMPQFVAEGKSQLVISVGCTGGQHRSVYIAEKLAEFFASHGYNILLSHRDLPKRIKKVAGREEHGMD